MFRDVLRHHQLMPLVIEGSRIRYDPVPHDKMNGPFPPLETVMNRQDGSHGEYNCDNPYFSHIHGELSLPIVLPQNGDMFILFPQHPRFRNNFLIFGRKKEKGIKRRDGRGFRGFQI
ncbi:hypothetical protein D3C71_1729970 [compost metagenome]